MCAKTTHHLKKNPLLITPCLPTFKINFSPKHCSKWHSLAFTFLTKEVLLPKMPFEIFHCMVVLMFTVGIAKVTKQMSSSHVSEQLIIVHKASITKLT